MSNKLFVGGLSWRTDEAMLREAFAPHGTITEVSVILDRDTGRSKGFGFVSFATAQSASTAMDKMSGALVDGRAVRVTPAERKPMPRPREHQPTVLPQIQRHPNGFDRDPFGGERIVRRPFRRRRD